METTPELIIFFVVAGVAVIAAIMMLTSENAVHSALSLVLNFACVAFLFLMLEAAFLAMVQVAVYAGAIMVLFMFVIMLLGGERLTPESKPRFPWLTPAAVVLTSIFLITAGVGILNSELSAKDPVSIPPTVRVISLLPEVEHITVSLNNSVLASELSFREASDITEWAAGEYTIAVEANGTTQPLTQLHYHVPSDEMNLAEQVNAELEGNPPAPVLERVEPKLTLEDGSDITLILTPLGEGWGIIPVEQNLDTIRRSAAARIQFVHANLNAAAVDVAEITQSDRKPHVIFENIPFGAVTEIERQFPDQDRYGVFEAGLIAQTAASTPDDENFKASDVVAIDSLKMEAFTANASTLYVLAPPLRTDLPGQTPEMVAYTAENRPAFGGPVNVGRLLFTSYMLPFQVIALLLLVAMIGAIVLTRDQVAPPRKRFQRRLASSDPE